MEDIGDILFYIIAAVIGLITTLGKKKKKPARKPVPAEAGTEEQADSGMILEEIFKTIDHQGDEADPEAESENEILREPVRVPSVETLTFKPGLEGSYDEPMAGQFANEGESQLDREESGEEMEEETAEILSGEDDDYLSDFDLRKAVIFSEILDRKDY